MGIRSREHADTPTNQTDAGPLWRFALACPELVSTASGAILTLNAGSSSIRFAVYSAMDSLPCVLAGKVDRIGLSGTRILLSVGADTSTRVPQRLGGANFRSAGAAFLDWFEAQTVFASVRAAGHRVVHGLQHAEPERITPRLLAQLRRITPYAPEHLPQELSLIDALAVRYPELPQVACFDTAFHRNMPSVAKRLPIPRRFATHGIERYGFHGLSYAFLMEELRRQDLRAAGGRVILAHLGNGASLAAVRGGQSIDTSMGFTPAAGLMMGTRTGDLDPGVASYLMRSLGMTPTRFQRMVNHESGLKGVSATTSDIRDLLAREATDTRAADAVNLFCYQAKKWIGSYAAVLGGVETLVFAGGIGEHAPLIRSRICDGLDFLGIDIHPERNAAGAPVISRDDTRVTVRVIATNEELMIARSVHRLLPSLTASDR